MLMWTCRNCPWYDEAPLEDHQKACPDCHARDGAHHQAIRVLTPPGMPDRQIPCPRNLEGTYKGRRHGQCRVGAPQHEGWPWVLPEDWCGCHPRLAERHGGEEQTCLDG